MGAIDLYKDPWLLLAFVAAIVGVGVWLRAVLGVVGAEGIEPSTSCVSSKRSPAELSAQGSPAPAADDKTQDQKGT